MAYKLLYLARRARTVSWQDWPRTWKSHAIFASQFPAMSGTIDWMRYTTRVDDPTLGDLPVSTEHDGVSVAAAPELDTFYGRGFSPEQRALIDQDELRVFDRYTPEFSFYCNESRVLDGPLGEAAVFRFLCRKADVSREAFEAHLKGEYARLCKESGRYAWRAALGAEHDRRHAAAGLPVRSDRRMLVCYRRRRRSRAYHARDASAD